MKSTFKALIYKAFFIFSNPLQNLFLLDIIMALVALYMEVTYGLIT